MSVVAMPIARIRATSIHLRVVRDHEVPSVLPGTQLLLPIVPAYLMPPAPRRPRLVHARRAHHSPTQLPLRWRVGRREKGFSMGTAPLTERDRRESNRLRLDLLPPTPKTRAECIDGPRPCLHYLCRHHLFHDVHPESGSLRVNFPGVTPDEPEETCSLDVADRARDEGVGASLEHVGALMGLTLERVRQIEKSALLDMALKLNVGVGEDTGPAAIIDLARYLRAARDA